MNIIEKLLGQGPRIEKQLRKEEKYYVGDIIVVYDNKGLFAEAYIPNKNNTKLKNVDTGEIIYVFSPQRDVQSAIRYDVIKKIGQYDKLHIQELFYCIAHFGKFNLKSKYFTSEGERKNKDISLEDILKLLEKIKLTNQANYQKELNKKPTKKELKEEQTSRDAKQLGLLSEKTRDF